MTMVYRLLVFRLHDQFSTHDNSRENNNTEIWIADTKDTT